MIQNPKKIKERNELFHAKKLLKAVTQKTKKTVIA